MATEAHGITHRVIDARAAGVAHFDAFADIDVLPTTDIPSLALGLLAIKDAQLGPAADIGSRAHLPGRDGDKVLGAAHSHLVDADQPLNGPATARWIDGDQPTRACWRALVTTQQGRLRAAGR